MMHADPEVDASAAVARTGRGESWLLDVREPHEWEAGHAPEAHFVPMGTLQDRIGELPDDAPILVICRSGGRSGMVSAALRRAGYAASNVVGGMERWRDVGGAVERTDGTPGSVI